MKRPLFITTLLLLSSCTLIPGPDRARAPKWTYPVARNDRMLTVIAKFRREPLAPRSRTCVCNLDYHPLVYPFL